MPTPCMHMRHQHALARYERINIGENETRRNDFDARSAILPWNIGFFVQLVQKIYLRPFRPPFRLTFRRVTILSNATFHRW